MRRIIVKIVTTASGDDWWNSQSKEQKAAYIKAHPRSKYAKQAGSAAPKATKTKTEKVESLKNKLVVHHKPSKNLTKEQIEDNKRYNKFKDKENLKKAKLLAEGAEEKIKALKAKLKKENDASIKTRIQKQIQKLESAVRITAMYSREKVDGYYNSDRHYQS
jgi:hypothetical protein